MEVKRKFAMGHLLCVCVHVCLQSVNGKARTRHKFPLLVLLSPDSPEACMRWVIGFVPISHPESNRTHELKTISSVCVTVCMTEVDVDGPAGTIRNSNKF